MDLRSFNVLSLCSGIGGLDVGIRLAVPGARTVCYVEREAYCIETLVSRMQEASLDDAPVWTDLTSFDGKPWRGIVDCITGGYPCQPFSLVGRRQGTDDPRHLWPHIRRIVEEIQPVWCFFENVKGHLSLGFDVVWRDLRDLGYEVEAGLFSAKEVGAPHLRERLFILAHALSDESIRQGRLGALGATPTTDEGEAPQREWHRDSARRGGEAVAYAEILSQREPDHETNPQPDRRQTREVSRIGGVEGFPDAIGESLGRVAEPWRERGAGISQPGLGGDPDGLPHWVDHRWPSRPDEPQHEWEPPRVRPDVPDRQRRLAALGNAVVPPTAALAFKTLLSRFQ